MTRRLRSVTLWSQHVPVSRRMLELTVGDDREIDRHLMVWDILASLGHIEGLVKSRLISAAEHQSLRRGLRDLLVAGGSGRVAIGPEHEDVHSAVEDALTKRIGRAGGKLHTARSRNDQIACDVRLYLKRALLDVHAAAGEAVAALLEFARKHSTVRLPGYTHGRRAMPSSLGLWAAAHAAGIIETMESFPSVWSLIDRSPLGSAAGYGVPLPLDRSVAARALGFASVQSPVTAVQNGRGKLEAHALFWCAQLGHDAAKAASDVILYSGDDHGYLTLDPALATGSSLMPHKRNPDLFELVRARAAAIEGELAAVMAVRGKLASGYHRDFQMLKAPLIRGTSRAAEMLEMLTLGVRGLRVDRARCAAALDGGVNSTAAALALAASGVPFREAHRQVSASMARRDPPSTSLSTPAALPPLALRELRTRAHVSNRFVRAEERRFTNAIDRLAGRA